MSHYNPQDFEHLNTNESTTPAKGNSAHHREVLYWVHCVSGTVCEVHTRTELYQDIARGTGEPFPIKECTQAEFRRYIIKKNYRVTKSQAYWNSRAEAKLTHKTR